MNRSKAILIGKCAAVLSVIPALIVANSGGALPRHTGAPGDQTCAECHAGTAVNGGGGNVSISAEGGTSYTPAQRQKLTVTITDANARVYGFSASARLVSNLENGQAGTLHAGTGTQLTPSGQVQFITHTMPSSTNRFEFDWTPPAAGAGDVRIYVAANAANGNGQNSGDRIYTANLTLSPGGASGTRPSISSGGVADAFIAQPGVASSAWTAIYGQNLSTTTRDWTGAPGFQQGKLPTSLDGVNVKINGRQAAVFFISPAQVNVLAPTDDATGDVQVIVTNSNGESTPATARKSQFLPAPYAPFGQSGRLFATVVENGTGALLGKTGVDPRVTRAARPGDVVQVYATGLGPTNPAIPADSLVTTPAPVTNTPSVRIADTAAEVLGAVLQSPGLYQINIRIPQVADGDQTFILETGGVRSANNVYLSVQR